MMWYPRSQNRDHHPTDYDLSEGVPDLGQPVYLQNEYEKQVLRLFHSGGNANQLLTDLV